MTQSTLKVEIWSDVMCPFCYIGKRRFEKALEQFPQRDNVEVVWKSFQLDPNTVTNPNVSINQYLADKKGWTLDHAKQINDHVTQMAKQVGLTYNFDKAIIANSFDAHRFSHLAKKHGVQDKAEEELFNAYFKEGKNTADHATLIELGTNIGLDRAEVKQTLDSTAFTDDVKGDIYEAYQIGVRGVPFFVLNDKYSVSGAQESETFLGALNKTWEEMEKEKPQPLDKIADGAVCGPDGDC